MKTCKISLLILVLAGMTALTGCIHFDGDDEEVRRTTTTTTTAPSVLAPATTTTVQRTTVEHD